MLAGTTLSGGDFVAVDIEATGCRPGSDDILEIGAARVSAGAIVGRFSVLVKPNGPIPPAIRHLTGIDDEMVASAGSVTDAMHAFRAFAEGAVLVAHNHRFDLGFLDYEAERAWGEPFQRPILDTLALSRRLHPELQRHNLRALAAFYGAETVPNHRAEADAIATAEIWTRMLPELEARGLATAGDAAQLCGLACQGALARKLVMATDLPDEPGVFLFRDAEGRVVYVGRAKNLRARVRSFFYAPTDSEQAGPALVASSVSHRVCPSPLDAVLVESRLLSRYRPDHHRDHERGRAAVYVYADTQSRFPSVRVVRRRYRRGTVIGPLSNRWAAETLVDSLREHFGLRRCARRLDGGAGDRPCARRADGTCPSPCLGVISSEDYKSRVDRALEVFDGAGPRFRQALQERREEAAADQRYEEAIAHRDALRAYDRTMSALRVVREATQDSGRVVIEGGDRGAALHFVRSGYLARTLRLSRAQLAEGGWEPIVERAVRQAFDGADGRPGHLSERQLRDVFLIHSYRSQQAPQEVAHGDDAAETARRVVSVVRRLMRLPVSSHGAPSDD